MQIKNHNGIFVGGAFGMARATAELFKERGGNIAIMDLPTFDGAAVAAELGATFHKCNVMDHEGIQAVLDAATDALGGSVHFLCNTEGGGVAAMPFVMDRDMDSLGSSVSYQIAVGPQQGC